MSELSEFRTAKDGFFARDHHAPLTRKQQRAFPGLAYFDEAPDLAFELAPALFDDPERVAMQTSTGDVAVYLRWARVRFAGGGREASLTIFRDEESGGLFLPFRDATSGQESYGAGRYLEVHPLPDGRLLVDFNYAYNPYCAFNDLYSCPIPPAENCLQVPIRAGERSYPGEHAEAHRSAG
ncbi:MAG: DUF1684 domain-containing protein [Chloroflexi bacterium]|nr:DUF1684 domain-containing protein [Chloroflexota bacterium]